MLRSRHVRTFAIAAAVALFLGVVVVLGADRAHQAPRLRLHAGAAWLASTKVGQLTLVDGSSAEVAARVTVAQSGSPLLVSQQESTGYVVNRWDSSVIRVDGATQQTTTSAPGVADTVFPTPHALYALDSNRGLLSTLDPVTLTPTGAPQALDAEVTSDGSVIDDSGRLWILDRRTGDLVWFSDGRHSRAQAATPGTSRLALADGAPVLVDPDRRTVEVLDPSTGEVSRSMHADLRQDDNIAVTGSGNRVLVSIGSRGLLMVCTDSCSPPVPLSTGSLGAATVAQNHAIVPDYTTGRVWIVNLASMSVVVERQLFDHPVRFELLNRDGVVFYNDPDGDQAGVLELDGRVRSTTKYDPVKPDKGAVQVAVDTHDTPRQPPSSGPAKPTKTAPADKVPPVNGPGTRNDPGPQDPSPLPPAPPTVSITVAPSTHGIVGDNFTFTAVASAAANIATAKWTFGDGPEVPGLAVTRHRWNRPGTFLVTVAATLTTGVAVPLASTTVTISAAGDPPSIIKINMSRAAPTVGERVSFSAEVGGGLVSSWEWEVDETKSTQASFEHTFTTAGTYPVHVTVRNAAGFAQLSGSITVAPEPVTVHCGDTLTANAVLKTDLTCPPDKGLTIAADNVTLDLGGHTLTTGNPTDTSTGIVVKGPETLDNITVQNGSVTGFMFGISLTDVIGASLSTVTTKSSSTADLMGPEKGADIFGVRARDVVVRNGTIQGEMSFVFDHESAISVIDSTTMTNTATRTRARCARGSQCTITGGSATMYLFLCFMMGDPDNNSTSSITLDNVNINIEMAGIQCKSVTIKNSRLVGGTVDATESLTFTNNVVTSNGIRPQQDLRPSGSFDISDNVFSDMIITQLWGGTGVVARNTFERNALAGFTIFQGGDVVVSDNKFFQNGHGSTPWPDEERGGLITHGTATGRSVTVRKNTASGNAGYGMWVATGNILDGGGNKSSGDEFGCFGVVCASG